MGQVGGPESSQDFAARFSGRFVLHGPAERKEGGSTDTSATIEPRTSVGDNTAPDNGNESVAEDNNEVTASDRVTVEDVVTSADNEVMEDESLLSRSTLGIDLVDGLRGKYSSDPYFQLILEKPNEFRNFEVENRVIYLKSAERRVLCIPKVLLQGQSARELVISEAHSMLAHLGASKTLDYMRDHVWWYQMLKPIVKHVIPVKQVS